MLIDPLSIHFSGAAGSTTVFGPDQAVFINQFSQLLLSCGWSSVQDLFATGKFLIPFGVPTSAGIPVTPKRKAGCPGYPGFVAIGADVFTFYDPFSETPLPGAGCIFVPMDTVEAQSVANLISFISASTDFDASAVPLGAAGVQINLVAKAAGPNYNMIPLAGNGSYVESSAPTGGGGVTMQSKGPTVYQVALTGMFGGGLFGNISFTFNVNNAPVQYQILDNKQGTQGDLGALGVGAVDQYYCIANPYGFCVMDKSNDTTTQIYRAISVFAMAPYFPGTEVPPSENFATSYAVLLIGPNAIGGPPAWSVISKWCLDGPPISVYGNNPWPRVLALRSPGPALLTAARVPMTTGAYVMFGNNAAEGSQAWVVGKLWDCAIVHGVIQDGAEIAGKHFIALGSSNGANGTTMCTLLMCAGQEYNPPPPPVPPVPPPPPRRGTVNLFGDGVTWISGDTFVPKMEGGPITIDGEPYLVYNVIDATHLTLTTAKVIAAGAAYSVP